jgi:hypothetical protein
LFCGIPLAASLLAAGAAGALEVLVAAGEDDVVGEVLELLLDPPQPARAKASPTAAVASQVLRLGVGIADSSLLSLWVPPGWFSLFASPARQVRGEMRLQLPRRDLRKSFQPAPTGA